MHLSFKFFIISSELQEIAISQSPREDTIVLFLF